MVESSTNNASHKANEELAKLISKDEDEIDYGILQYSGTNALQAFLGGDFINETVCPVDILISGSTAEHLKLFMHGDIGDFDLMAIPAKIAINESSLEYRPDNPCFVHIIAESQIPEIRKYCDDDCHYISTHVLRDMPCEIFGHWNNISRFAMKFFEMTSDTKVEYKDNDEESVAKTYDILQTFGTMKEQIYSDRGENLNRRLMSTLFSAIADSHGMPYSDCLPDIVESLVRKASLHKKETRIDKLRRVLELDWKKYTQRPTPINVLLPKDGLQCHASNNEETCMHASKEVEAKNNPEAFVKDQYSQYRDNVLENQRVAEQAKQIYEHEDCYNNIFDCSECDEKEAGTTRQNDQNDTHIVDSTTTEGKSGTSCDNDLCFRKKQWVQCGIDLVPAFKLRGWPKPAQQWITREKTWPHISVINEILSKNVSLVAKSPPKDKHINTDFRLSFSEAEIILSRSLTPIQRQCYRAVKMLQKATIFIEDEKTLISFHLKTCLYWVLESKYPEFWESNDLLTLVKHLLEYIKKRIQDRYLGQYFIPDFNMFAHFSSATFVALERKICEAIADPVGQLKKWRGNSASGVTYTPCSEPMSEPNTTIDMMVFRTAYDQISEEIQHALMPNFNHIQDFGDLTNLVQLFRSWKVKYGARNKKFKDIFKTEQMYNNAVIGSIASDSQSHRQLVIEGLEHTLPYADRILSEMTGNQHQTRPVRRFDPSVGENVSSICLPEICKYFISLMSNEMEQGTDTKEHHLNDQQEKSLQEEELD